MSTKKPDERPDTIQTDAESQEYGAQHGQTPRGRETGSSAAGEGAADAREAERTGEGTGARGGEYS